MEQAIAQNEQRWSVTYTYCCEPRYRDWKTIQATDEADARSKARKLAENFDIKKVSIILAEQRTSFQQRKIASYNAGYWNTL